MRRAPRHYETDTQGAHPRQLNERGVECVFSHRRRKVI
jgi:hypothetical protein